MEGKEGQGEKRGDQNEKKLVEVNCMFVSIHNIFKIIVLRARRRA